jgi:putative sterol carrier protein
MVPRPDSLASFMTFLRLHLHSEAVGDETVILQFHFSGEVADTCHFVIRRDQVEAKSGTDPAPDLVIETPFGTWMDIMTRKADGQQMFMEGKYKVQGDIGLMIRLFQKDEQSGEAA